MNKQIYYFLFLIVVLFSCTAKEGNTGDAKLKNTKKLLTFEDTLKYRIDTLLRNSKPIMGYRFVVYGDFNGDKIQDTIIERYTDSLKLKETNKYYDNLDYFDNIFVNNYLGKTSIISIVNLKSKDLVGGQLQLGLHYMENCGDLNLDGGDEILIVPQNSDMSNLNQASIYSFKNSQWDLIYSIPVWEWQFPSTPSASMLPGLFGNFNVGYTQSDSIDKILEADLKKFKYFSHFKDNSIEFECMNPFDYDEVNEGFEKYGQQEYIKKHFRKVYIQDSLYLQDKKNTSVFYKCETQYVDKGQCEIFLMPLDDPAEKFTVRIYLNSQSPFVQNK